MFLEKSYRGNNKWYFYILTLIIVFAAVQVASIPVSYTHLTKQDDTEGNISLHINPVTFQPQLLQPLFWKLIAPK